MKIKFIILFISLLIFSWCWEDEQTEVTSDDIEENVETTEPKTILALWDSITAGYTLPIEDSYPSQLEAILQENNYNYELINAGVSGNTSAQLLKRLDLYLEDEAEIPEIAIVVIWWNDGLQGQSTSDMQDNIQQIVERLQEKNIEVVIWGMQIPPNRGLSYFSAFKKVYKDVAKETDAELIPFFLDDVATKWVYNLPDMIHPNKDGYAIIAQNTFEFLKKNKLIQDD